MNRILQFGTSSIPYSLIRRKQAKTIKVTVELEHRLEVIVPQDFDARQLDPILRAKGAWILDKLRKLDEVDPPPPPKEYVSGEKFPLLGYGHELIVEERAERKPFVVLQQNNLIVTIKPNLSVGERRAAVRDTLHSWYFRQAAAKLPEQVALYAPKLGVQPEKVAVMDLDRRWGSCTPSGAIYLNWRLVLAPIRIIDYIAVHELCHLPIPDHSPAFWEQVRVMLSDYEERREWLRVNGPTLFV